MDTRILEEIKNICAMVTLVLEKLDGGNLSLQPVLLPPDEMVNIQRAAEIMGVSVSTIERRRRAGIICYYKTVGPVSYSRNNLIAVTQTLNRDSNSK